jgi:hypothetical protein
VPPACGDEAIIRKSLRELMEELDPEVFWQVHRSQRTPNDARPLIQRSSPACRPTEDRDGPVGLY